jgi:hypothetical protein
MLYHPEHGWMEVGMLTTEEQWGLKYAGKPRPFPKEDIQLTRLSRNVF